MRTACLYFSHTVTDTAAEGLKDQTRRQETGASRSPQEWRYHSEKADFSIARTEGGTPAASQERGRVIESMVQLLADLFVCEHLSLQLIWRAEVPKERVQKRYRI